VIPEITLDVINDPRYYERRMIKTFASKETEALFEREASRVLPMDTQRKARLKLEILDAVEKLDDLRVPPGNRLQKLKGNRAGQYSIRIHQQWRICFRWKNGDCYDVEIVDYHSGD
jgi:proteic killer suppression protein